MSTKKNKHGRRESIFYAPFWAIMRPALRLYLKGNAIIYHRLNEEVHTPCIIVGNHSCFLDWFFAAELFPQLKPNFVMSRYYLDNHWYSWVLRDGGVLGKSVFAPDTQSAIVSIRILKEGGVLGIYPEARISASHTGEIFPDETANLVKRLGLPVYGIQTDGGSFLMPKWGSLTKGARVEVHAKKLFAGPELKDLSVEEISATLAKEIYFDDFAYLEKHPELHFRLKNGVKGMENVLYRCPKCHKEYTISAHGMALECTCGFKVESDDRFHFSDNPYVKNEQDWFFQEKQLLKEEILADAQYAIDSKVRIRYGKNYVGEGMLHFDRQGIRYKGTDYGKEVFLFFPAESYFVFPFKAGDNFVVFQGKRCYIFCPENGKEAIKYSLASDILYRERMHLLPSET